MKLKKRATLRILILSSHFYPKVDGTTRSIDKIIKSLISRGHIVRLLTRRFPSTPSFEIYNGAETYRTGPLGFSAFTRFLFGINQARLAIKVLKSTKVDIFEAHGFSSMIACFLLKRMFNKPIVLFFHGLPRIWIGKFKWRKGYEQLLSFPFERFLIRQADSIVVRSNLFAKILIDIYGRGFERRIMVLPHPVNTRVFKFHPPISADPNILFVGSLAKVYGVDLLLRAAVLVLNSAPKSRFVIVGDGPLRKHLEKMAYELGIQRSVQFVGRIDDIVTLAGYYHMSTVTVIPLYYKGYILSLVAVEALACGRPVVTTMTLEPGLEKVGVFTVRTYEPSDLSRSILHVISDVDLNALATSAAKYVRKYHSEQSYGLKLERAYRQLIKSQSKTVS